MSFFRRHEELMESVIQQRDMYRILLQVTVNFVIYIFIK
jgi:hypothetical protein